MTGRDQVYADITGRIIEALETADPADWSAPWHGTGTIDMPTNVRSGKAYRGSNVVSLWSEAMLRGYEHGLWGTYNQWQEKGAQVRKGERGSLIVFWKPMEYKDKNDPDAPARKTLLARGYKVHNVAQVDGYDMPAPDVPDVSPIDHAETWFKRVGADVTHGGNRAYYTPAADRIQLPALAAFNTAEDYYSTSAHEHTHWTSHPSRCDRPIDSNRFGSEAYAFEELVAELGAAYVCGHLRLSNEPRADHAQYLASWLKVLRHDPKAIVTAASKAQAACDYLCKLGDETTEGPTEGPAPAESTPTPRKRANRGTKQTAAVKARKRKTVADEPPPGGWKDDDRVPAPVASITAASRARKTFGFRKGGAA